MHTSPFLGGLIVVLLAPASALGAGGLVMMLMMLVFCHGPGPYLGMAVGHAPDDVHVTL
jgi:hypothetical protein